MSVIIPVYNIDRFLAECLESVLNQTLSQLQVLCIDDGSTDGSLSIIKSYQSQDPRLELLTQAHQGVSAARNLGLANARGRYCFFADGDDWLEPDALAHLVTTADRDQCDLVVCSAAVHFESTGGSPRQRRTLVRSLTAPEGLWQSDGTPDTVWNELKKPAVWPFIWNKLIRTDLLRSHALTFSAALSLGEDGVFLQLLYHHVTRVAYISRPLYHYRYLRKASATVTLCSSLDARFSQHISAVSVLLDALSKRSLLETEASQILTWMVSFLYDDSLHLSEACREASALQLSAHLARHGLSRTIPGLSPIIRQRMERLTVFTPCPSAARKKCRIIRAKIENRSMRLRRRLLP